MKFKNLIIATFASLFCVMASAKESSKGSLVIANEDSCSVETIQSAIDACILLAQSAEANDTAAIRKAKDAMKECNLAHF